MGSSTQILRFRVVKEDSPGPVRVAGGSNQMYIFPVSVTAQRLRFEVVEPSGGNTRGGGAACLRDRLTNVRHRPQSA